MPGGGSACAPGRTSAQICRSKPTIQQATGLRSGRPRYRDKSQVIGLSVREETGDQVVLLIRIKSAPEGADLRGQHEGVIIALRGEGAGPFWGACIEGLTRADVGVPGSLEKGGEFLVGAER